MELEEVEELAKELGIDFKDMAILYRSYIEDVRNLTYKLQDALAGNDSYVLKRSCTLIKSASYNMKITLVYKAALELQYSISSRDYTGMERNVGLVCKALSDVEEELKEVFTLKGIKL